MALIDKLTAIAEAIRGKTGGTDPLTLEEMVSAIASIENSGGGVADSLITVETVIATESFTNGAGVANYVTPIFTSSDSKKLCFLQALVVKDVTTAKQTNNGFLGVYSFSWGSKIELFISRILRWRSGDYGTAQNGTDWDIILKSGTELYLVTIDFERQLA